MQNYNCKNCGAVLYWDTESDSLKCRFCDSEYQVSDFEDRTDTEEKVKDEAINKEFAQTDDVGENMSVYECKNCGGEVLTLNTTMATICPYCSEAISITSKSVGDFRPDLCIPFKKSKEEIMKIYQEYVNKSFLTPKAFKEQNTIEKIQGLFTPFYLHDIEDKTYHEFEGERTSSSKRGYDKVTTHRVFRLTVSADGKFEKIPTDASVKISNQLMDAIEPFHYKGLKEYNPAYMAGFMAEQMDDDKEDMAARALVRAKTAMKDKARDEFTGYQGVRCVNERNDIRNHTTSYTMLPVWLLNVNHDNQKYTFAINGQTGKIVGKLPIDKMKLFLIGCGTFLLSDIAIAALLMFMG